VIPEGGVIIVTYPQRQSEGISKAPFVFGKHRILFKSEGGRGYAIDHFCIPVLTTQREIVVTPVGMQLGIKNDTGGFNGTCLTAGNRHKRRNNTTKFFGIVTGQSALQRTKRKAPVMRQNLLFAVKLQ